MVKSVEELQQITAEVIAVFLDKGLSKKEAIIVCALLTSYSNYSSLKGACNVN